jgi:hypothetical protein
LALGAALVAAPAKIFGGGNESPSMSASRSTSTDPLVGETLAQCQARLFALQNLSSVDIAG